MVSHLTVEQRQSGGISALGGDEIDGRLASFSAMAAVLLRCG